MQPYASLNINDGTEPDPTDPIGVTPNIGSDVASDANLVLNAYIYSVWYDVEMDFPLTTESIPNEKAYAITNVFYFLHFVEPIFSSTPMLAKFAHFQGISREKDRTLLWNSGAK